MTNRSPATRGGWWRFLLAALAAALVGLLGAGTASAVTLPELGNRVGASPVATQVVVGVHECITAGQRWGNAPPQAESVSATGVAAKSADEGVDLFRHVSPGELTDIGENGFRAGPGSLDGKWFAESGAHASEWGRVLNGGEGSVVRVRVPNTFADQLMRLEKLDGIGPARYVEPHQLAELNRYPRGLR